MLIFERALFADDQIVQAVAIDVGRVQQADLIVDGKNLVAGEGEAGFVRVRLGSECDRGY